MRNKAFYEVVKSTKENFPLRYPVHVRRVLVPQDRSGDCWLNYPKREFVIRVDKKLPQLWAIDVFLHEYAHAMAWNTSKKHDDEWGVAYSQVYRNLLELWGIETKKKVAKLQ